MAEDNIFQAMLDNMQIAITQLEGGEATSKDNDFNLKDFWVSLNVSASSLSTEVTKLCVLFSKPPVPSAQQTDEVLRKIEALYVSMLMNFYGLPKSEGQVLRKKVQRVLLKLIESLKAVLKSLKETGIKGQKDRMKLAGWVWESCEAVEHLPHDNLTATCKELEKEQMFVMDALQEIEDEVKAQEGGLEGINGEELDNSERWSNQDRELLPPCVALVRTARSCLRRVRRAVQAQGRCCTEHEVAQLDDLVAAVARLSPAVDDFVSSVYPPMNRDAVKSTAMEVVDELQAILLVVKQSHYVLEEDQGWVSFLLKAVDHNNNKLQPLLTL